MMRIVLDPPPDRTSGDIASMVASELTGIADPRLANALKRFVVSPPRMEMRTWEWSRPAMEFPTWVAAESADYDYGLVYSDNGFGPDRPWGLVFSSHDSFGADYCWYPRLIEAFLESRLVEEFDADTQAFLAAATRDVFRSGGTT